MKKIAICINTSWNIYNFRVGLINALRENGYQIIIIAPLDKYSTKLQKMGFEYYDIKMNSKSTNPIEDLKLTYNYYTIFKKIKPNIILNYTIKPNIYGTIAANMLKIPTINNIAGLGTLFVNENYVTKIVKILYKYSQDRAQKVFFQNKDDYELFVSKNIVDANKCDILPGSGINTDEFRPINKRVKSKNLKFLLISRMLWEKGIVEYVEASKIIKEKYKNIEFELLGFIDIENKHSIPQKQIQTWVDESLINYLGSSDNIKEQIMQADCIVLPSFYREGTPRTLLEAASMAKPIITTDNIGCRDVVDNGVNGFLCQIKDSNDLALKMEAIINLSENARVVMGEKGRKKMIKEFDEEIVIKKYLLAIEKID